MVGLLALCAATAFDDALLTAMMYLRLKGGWRPAPDPFWRSTRSRSAWI